MAVFRFKQFTLNQDVNPMKVGTDSTLLGAMVKLDGVKHVLDVGTGTGVLALMIAQRCPTAQIDAIEIDASSCEECRSNFEQAPWSARLNAYPIALQAFVPNKQYDLIVSNPPYFDASSQPIQSSRTNARQQTMLTHEALLQHSLNGLNSEGTLALVLPTETGKRLMDFAMKKYGLHCHRLIEIFGKPGTEAKRLIMELCRKPCSQPEQASLTIELGQRHHYSKDYLQLMRDFLFLEGNSVSR